MTPQSVLDLVKRTAKISAAGNYTDQNATDLLKHLNIRCFQVWRFHDWEFSLDDLSFSVGPADYDKTLPATTGEVLELAIQGESGYLRRHSRREYLQWLKRNNTTDTGSLVGYIHRGRDSSGNIKLRFFATPSSAQTVEGLGKKRLTAITAADVAAGTAFAYFPEEMHDIIYRLVLADGYRMNSDDRADTEEKWAMAELGRLKGQEESQADLDPGSPPPDYIRFVHRNRGSGSRTA